MGYVGPRDEGETVKPVILFFLSLYFITAMWSNKNVMKILYFVVELMIGFQAVNLGN